MLGFEDGYRYSFKFSDVMFNMSLYKFCHIKYTKVYKPQEH